MRGNYVNASEKPVEMGHLHGGPLARRRFIAFNDHVLNILGRDPSIGGTTRIIGRYVHMAVPGCERLHRCLVWQRRRSKR